MVDTGQQWAEVNFVPAWTTHSKNSPDYRYLAIREPMSGRPPDRQVQLPFYGDARQGVAQALRGGDQP